MNKQHTPTPDIHLIFDEDGDPDWIVQGDRLIASIAFQNERGLKEAERIIKTWNNHDRLVQALEKLVETTFDSSCQHFNAHREAKKLLTELKEE